MSTTCEICGRREARFVCSRCGRKACWDCFDTFSWLCRPCYEEVSRREPEIGFPALGKWLLVGILLLTVGMILMAIGLVASGEAALILLPLPILVVGELAPLILIITLVFSLVLFLVFLLASLKWLLGEL